MRRISQASPSPAFIVAVVALLVALGGGAVAGVTMSKLNKKEKAQVKRIAKRLDRKAINGIPSGPEGPRGVTGPQGERGPIGTVGPTGPQGEQGDDASSLVRVAGATNANPDDADGEMVSTTITAPASGNLMVVASVDSGAKPPGAGIGLDGFDCLIKLDDDSTEYGYNSVRVTYPDNGEEDCGTNVLLPVEAGPHDVSFIANSVRTDDVALREARIQALFVPTG